MKVLELLKRLKTIEKPFFSTSDLEKITGLNKASLKVNLSRLCKKGLINRISKGIFILPENLDKIPEIANQLYDPSYLSFESALSRYGILSQIPYTITFATTKRSKRIVLFKTEVEYHQLKPSLFTGFLKEGNLFIAYPEKALLDQFYLVSKGMTTLSFKELDFGQINKSKFIKLSKIFPKSTQKLARKMIENHL